VILAVLGTWLLLSALTTVAFAAVVRGGADEERMEPYSSDRRPADAFLAP
jgi:hypothetical protein